MKVNYKYTSSSMCTTNGNNTILGLSPDVSRDETVSFLGKLKHPLVFRDAMLMLRQIVISDMTIKKKERVDFFQWLEREIDRRILNCEEYLKSKRNDLQGEMKTLENKSEEIVKEIEYLSGIKATLKKEIDSTDIWKDYYKIERKFWDFIKNRDHDLWFVLDPVITVHKDQVSFEAFSVDESTYGCLSIDMDEFELLKEPKLGTTNIDFSEKLAMEIERFRTYSDVKLSVNPDGFKVKNNISNEYIEKKIDLPESWIKGFNEVSCAASMDGIEVELSKADIYDICSFLRSHKAKKSPRYMKWVLEPGQNIKIVFEPFSKEITLNAIYNGSKKREEKIWGRRRWLVIEKLIPLSKVFKVKILGFGMPQFIVADMGTMKMTIGFSAWSAKDWVKGTAFNILAGFVGNGNYESIYTLLKDKRSLSMDEINKQLGTSNTINKAGLGMFFKKGEGYYDLVNNKIRFRRLINEELPNEMYKSTSIEEKVLEHLDEGMDNFRVIVNDEGQYIFKHCLKMDNPKYHNYKYYRTPDFERKYINTETEIVIDEDGQIVKLTCNCREFKKGSRNISEPCSHILALYIISTKFLKVKLEPNKEYKINDIMEKIL